MPWTSGILCLISRDFATCSLALHKHVVNYVVKGLSTFPSLALTTLAPMFSFLRTTKNQIFGYSGTCRPLRWHLVNNKLTSIRPILLPDKVLLSYLVIHPFNVLIGQNSEGKHGPFSWYSNMKLNKFYPILTVVKNCQTRLSANQGNIRLLTFHCWK